MKASKLIKILQKKIEEYGDLKVTIPTDQEVTGKTDDFVVAVTTWLKMAKNHKAKATRFMIMDKFTAEQLR